MTIPKYLTADWRENINGLHCHDRIHSTAHLLGMIVYFEVILEISLTIKKRNKFYFLSPPSYSDQLIPRSDSGLSFDKFVAAHDTVVVQQVAPSSMQFRQTMPTPGEADRQPYEQMAPTPPTQRRTKAQLADSPSSNHTSRHAYFNSHVYASPGQQQPSRRRGNTGSPPQPRSKSSHTTPTNLRRSLSRSAPSIPNCVAAEEHPYEQPSYPTEPKQKRRNAMPGR